MSRRLLPSRTGAVMGASKIPAPDRAKSIRCVVSVRSIPIECYRHSNDGQKWKQPAANRRALLLELATYANSDGTFLRPIGGEIRNYSPSFKKLQNAGYSRASLYRMMDSLYDLGLLSWDRK